MHTYKTRRNKQNIDQSTTSLPPSQPGLPQAPNLIAKQLDDYDLVEKLRVTPAKISLRYLLQIYLLYQSILQEALQNIMLPSSTKPTYVNVLMDHIHVDTSNITFYMHKISPLEVRILAGSLMLIVCVNSVGILVS